MTHPKDRADLQEAIARIAAERAEPEIWHADTTAGRDRIEALLLQQPGMAEAQAEFDAMAAEATVRLEAEATSHREAAAEASRNRAGARSAMSAERLQGLQATADVGTLPGDRQSILLQTPSEISLSGAFSLTDHGIAPGESYARFTFVLGRDRNERAYVVFSYVWQNPENRYAIIDAHGYLILDGYVEARLGAGFWPRDRHARIAVTPGLTLHDLGPEPRRPSAYMYPPAAAMLALEDNGWAVSAPIASTPVFRGFDRDLYHYIVEPHGTIGLQVWVEASGYTKSDGSRVEADFADGSYGVVSPGVLILVIS